MPPRAPNRACAFGMGQRLLPDVLHCQRLASPPYRGCAVAEVALEEGANSALPWVGPEVVAVAVLVTVGLLALGGLAEGIYVATSNSQPFVDPFANVWNSITFGASWAEPLLALFLLGATGVCWWHVDRWSDDIDDSSGVLEPALGYIRRAQRIASWALGGLSLTVLGSVAGLIANIGIVVLSQSIGVADSRVIGAAASTTAVLAIGVAGSLVVRETRRMAVVD